MIGLEKSKGFVFNLEDTETFKLELEREKVLSRDKVWQIKKEKPTLKDSRFADD